MNNFTADWGLSLKFLPQHVALFLARARPVHACKMSHPNAAIATGLNFTLPYIISHKILWTPSSWQIYDYFFQCKGADDDDFCETLSDKKEPYYGYAGMLKCLREGEGDVGFFHTHDVIENFDELSKEFDVVCRNKKLPLEPNNIYKKGCHLAEEHPQVYKHTSLVRERGNFQVRNTKLLHSLAATPVGVCLIHVVT